VGNDGVILVECEQHYRTSIITRQAASRAFGSVRRDLRANLSWLMQNCSSTPITVHPALVAEITLELQLYLTLGGQANAAGGLWS
jgi:hypothetical protein